MSYQINFSPNVPSTAPCIKCQERTFPFSLYKDWQRAFTSLSL